MQSYQYNENHIFKMMFIDIDFRSNHQDVDTVYKK